jgi:hypothetical protein
MNNHGHHILAEEESQESWGQKRGGRERGIEGKIPHKAKLVHGRR